MSLANKAVTDVIDIVNEVLDLHRDGAGKAHVMFIEPVVDGRRAEDEIRPSTGRLVAEPDDDTVVDVHRQMRPMLLDGANRKQNYPSAVLGRAARLGPGH